jgi:steroid delta-isomerase-like uncharacterized protein
MSAPTAVSPQALLEAAQAPLVAYNEKNWDKAKASITADFVYDEVATRRKVQGRDEAITLWKGWAQAFPDSKCSFDRTSVSGNVVVFEVTWRGTHQGQLESAQGPVPPTGKRIEVRAASIMELAGEKVREQRHYFDMATLFEQLGLKA